jgi:regulator of protease activity HflC (stomatin/prohibitin superfamily)
VHNLAHQSSDITSILRPARGYTNIVVIATSPQREHQHTPARAIPGPSAGGAAALATAIGLGLLVAGLAGAATGLTVAGAVVLAIDALALKGFVVIQPNSSRVLILFGRYVGTLIEPGLWWVNPFTAVWRRTVSLRVRNFQSERIKVNDSSGNPIEIAAVVVWRVVDTAKATFDVQDYEQFVVVQSETAVRHLASKYPYDDYDETGVTLRGSSEEVLASLHTELQARLDTAGIEVLETRLTHLAYAPEIAEVMLRRQQAEAILAARKKMVAGAVGIVQMALAQLADSDLVELDPERKAAMVSNLMVVLSGDHAPTPVLNTGSLYT